MPTPPDRFVYENSVFYVVSVPNAFATQYYVDKYHFEHGRGPSAERPHAAPSRFADEDALRPVLTHCAPRLRVLTLPAAT